MKLTDRFVKTVKPKEKAYKLTDGGGLYLQVQPNGSKLWRLRYYFLGKEKLLSIGSYPTVTLAEARAKREEVKKLLVNGHDPAVQKREEKREAIRKAANTFEALAREWHEKQKDQWTPNHASCVMRRLEANVFPHIGSRLVQEIDALELLECVLRRIEKRGANEVAARVKQICGQVFRYGIVTGRCQRDPSFDLKDALKKARGSHYAALDIKEMPEFLAALERNDARLFGRTRRGIRLLMLCFTRTSELIRATWDEFDLENGVWEIPAERMKMRRPHVVPLSRQAIEILREQQRETGDFNTRWVLPSQIKPRDPMSNNTILFAIGRMGYKGRMTGHGFRALAMTTIKERLGYRHEVVDRQLAHAPVSKVDRAYDRAQFLEERTFMMQDWADYLDLITERGSVPPIIRQSDQGPLSRFPHPVRIANAKT
ncbi:MAG TPA: integrase arm-type DNA-binding domain-containing protein [Chthoniobacteraceae bacterium]|nr:integrase arm-type DNA-binding domain-containing protein [Chthoniobacteraceae bacterium]